MRDIGPVCPFLKTYVTVLAPLLDERSGIVQSLEIQCPSAEVLPRSNMVLKIESVRNSML